MLPARDDDDDDRTQLRLMNIKMIFFVDHIDSYFISLIEFKEKSSEFRIPNFSAE